MAELEGLIVFIDICIYCEMITTMNLVNLTVIIFFLIMGTFKIYSLRNFQIYAIVWLTIITMLYITYQNLSHFFSFVFVLSELFWYQASNFSQIKRKLFKSFFFSKESWNCHSSGFGQPSKYSFHEESFKHGAESSHGLETISSLWTTL